MAKVKQFEDLLIWQKAREICKKIHILTQKEGFLKEFTLKNQWKSSTGSIMDNIAEGFERNGDKEFKQFLSIAKASTGEARSQSYRAYDCGYITKEEFNDLYKMLKEESCMIASFMKYLGESEFTGSKYK